MALLSEVKLYIIYLASCKENGIKTKKCKEGCYIIDKTERYRKGICKWKKVAELRKIR